MDEKTVQLCADIATASEMFEQAMMIWRETQRKISAAGITLTDAAAAIAADNRTGHATADDYTAALFTAGELDKAMTADLTFVPGYHATNIAKAARH